MGEILFGGRDIATLKLHDLFQASSFLFHDYNDFLLSVRTSYLVLAYSLTPSPAT